uniref:Uncharacterized protein n=1 Tax=Anguilla anguilla TaxID=7936 RepID=A0A0E9RSC8_ANGAN
MRCAHRPAGQLSHSGYVRVFNRERILCVSWARHLQIYDMWLYDIWMWTTASVHLSVPVFSPLLLAFIRPITFIIVCFYVKLATLKVHKNEYC